MDEDVRRDRGRHAIGEFERRILERALAIDGSECVDLLRNCPSGVTRRNGDENKPPALEYVTLHGRILLRVNDLERENRACAECELFGLTHCCGGLGFLVWALANAGVARPAELLADAWPSAGPGMYAPNWEKMERNLEVVRQSLRRFFRC
jgi:hypothetical protein